MALRETILTLERERQNRLMNVEAIIASIAHEVRQPLAAITMNANAASRFSRRSPPDYGEVEAALARIAKEVIVSAKVFESIRILFQQDEKTKEPLDANEATRETLQSLRGELEDHGVTTYTEFAAGLPLVQGHKSQLQQVIVNLVHNSIEAMATLAGRNRLLRVKTDRHGRDAVIVVVEDLNRELSQRNYTEFSKRSLRPRRRGWGWA